MPRDAVTTAPDADADIGVNRPPDGRDDVCRVLWLQDGQGSAAGHCVERPSRGLVQGMVRSEQPPMCPRPKVRHLCPHRRHGSPSALLRPLVRSGL